MKSFIKWAIDNTPAMNTLMAAILIVGAVSLYFLHREVFPEFELEIVLITVPYPGASPEEVEEGICQKLEEAVQAIDGIKNVNSVAREGVGNVILELESDVPDAQKVLNEIRSEVERIPSLPELAEDPEIKQITLRREAIQVGVIGPDDDSPEAEVALRDVAERVRNALLQLKSVSQAELLGTKQYQIDIEIPELTLRKYGLTLQDVARIVRQENIEVPGGTMRTDSQEVLLRGKNKHEIGHEIAKIPLVTDASGVVLTVGDLGEVRDEFEDVTAEHRLAVAETEEETLEADGGIVVATPHRINGKPALVIKVDKTAKEDLLAITKEVQDFVNEVRDRGESAGFRLPQGYRLRYWADVSVVVEDRLHMLAKNGIQGLALVFLVLAAFLEIRLAFWVALGIPIAVLGACAIMLYTGQTLNMLSMFAFLMALGIVVDDAIVVGENIYAHRQMGKQFVSAAVDGTVEVLPSVLASVTTTIIAFVPLMLVPGIMGKFIAVMPMVVIAMLVISLVESTFILPCHLAHSGERDEGNGTDDSKSPVHRARRFVRRFPGVIRWTFGLAWLGVVSVAWFFLYPLVRGSHWLNDLTSRFLDVVINRGYMSMIRWSLRHPSIVLTSAAAFLMISVGLILGGIVPFNVFPKLDGNSISASIQYPDGTSARITDEATRLVEKAIWQVNDELAQEDNPVVVLTHRIVGQQIAGDMVTGAISTGGGSHVGQVAVELKATEDRGDVTSMDVVARWRKRVLTGLADAESGEQKHLTAGYEALTFGSTGIGPGGAPLEVRLLAAPERMEQLEEAVERCKQKLKEYPGVFDIVDDSRPGKWEFQVAVKDDAKAMGVPLSDLAGTVRAAYYGEEVMRLQRGRHEVKLMVRYPREERRSLANFDDIQIRTGGGAERPLTELAEVTVERGYSAINRLDQLRSVTITADVEETKGNAQEITDDLRENFLPELLAEYPGVSVRWEGQQEQRKESIGGLMKGLTVALLCMFALLTLEFRTYLQPLLILGVIPFAAIGAVAGHWLLGIPVSLFSLFGMVALTGVVVNDSIVLIDFMNRRVRDGMPLLEAIQDAGRRRFRPVLLTSVTTVAALLPILVERSFQAQVVIPMATSLAFGLLFATLLILILVPTSYLLYCRYLAPDMLELACTEAQLVEEPQPSLALKNFKSGEP
ncbi:MAG: efflux RND transporter permease subunit [Pirellulaceae bacterium]|nr:efflux RND transporter permease subunit [Pirellulaceae bacterium]